MSVAIDTCSGTRDLPIADAYLIGCSGDLVLSNGEITSDGKVIISGASSLTIVNVKIAAQEIEIKSNGSVSIGDGVTLTANVISSISSGSNSLQGPPTCYASSGATISIGGSTQVPIDAACGVLTGDVVLRASSSGSISPSSGSITLAGPSASQQSGGGALSAPSVLALLIAILTLVWIKKPSSALVEV